LGKYFAPTVTGNVGTLKRRRMLVTALYGGYALFCFAITVGLNLPQPARLVGLAALLLSFGVMWWGFFTLTGLMFGNRAVDTEDEAVVQQARRDTIKREARPYAIGAVIVAGIFLGLVALFAPRAASVTFVLAVVLGAFIVAATLPTVMIAWTEPDPAPAPVDPYDVIDHKMTSMKLFGE
jgi:hypothetical protein